MFKLKISSRALMYFLLASILPMAASTYILVNSANNQLVKAASLQQQAIANDLTDRVNNYLTSKIKSLVGLSELYSSPNLSKVAIDQDMAVLLNQDTDMQRVALVNGSGYDQVVFTRSGEDNNLENESNSDAFKAVGFLSGKDYVSSVSYNAAHQPIITIAIPVLASNYGQKLTDLKNANFGSYSNSSDIEGAVIASYNTSQLWQSVLSTKVGPNGYAYIIDGLGNLVAYPNINFLENHPKLTSVQAVNQFINSNLSTEETISETGQKVISTPKVIPNSGWAVIVEEPVNNVDANVNNFIKLSTIIGISDIIITLGLSFFFSKQLTVPIRKLTQGAKRFGEGDFQAKIIIKSSDELRELADTFNLMGASINKLVSDLKVNNLNLKIEQSKLNNIIASVSDGVIALNKDGTIVSANPPAAQLIGAKVPDIVGRKMDAMYAWQSEDRPLTIKLNAPGLFNYNDLSLYQGDNIYYLDLTVSVLDHKDSDVAAIITMHDLTKNRELEFMKLDFVAIAAHELRTPLTVVKGYLDMVNEEAIKKITIAGIESLQKAIQGTDQLRDLINKLLNIARIERGDMEIFIEKLDLSKLVKDSVHEHETPGAQKEQRLSFVQSTDRTIFVAADPSSIKEVMNNLLGNAIKYTQKGGTVRVHLSVKNDQALVEVADNGPGVPANMQNRLFTKFYRAERSLTAGTRGTGLGLFISKTIIQLQGGKIGLLPESGPKRNSGSTFYFTLPIYVPGKHDRLVSKDKQIGGIHGWFKKRNDRR